MGKHPCLDILHNLTPSRSMMYLFIRQPESGKTPIESIMPDATEMPFCKMINDLLRTVMGVENVNRNAKMADSELLLSA
ncbi:hypothetical protein ACFL6S_22960 [Candidatus Poribacteria bacterium]